LRVASVLLVDLVGFTSLSDGREAEDVRELLSRYFASRKQVLVIRADPLSPDRGQYAFAQGLLRTVAYGMLSRQERKPRHREPGRFSLHSSRSATGRSSSSQRFVKGAVLVWSPAAGEPYASESS
jgi:hypothetical protein